MNEIQQHLQESLSNWADITLQFDVMNQEKCIVPDEYNDQALLDVTLLFQHVVMNKSWHCKKGLDMDTRMEKAEEFGKTLRDLLKDFTGKDMHELAKVK